MKIVSRFAAFGLVLAASHLSLAQAPAGATGACKDGSYTTNATKSGACSGHKGVKEWYADPKKAPAATPAPAAAPAASPTPAAAPVAPKPAAAKTNSTKAEVAQAPGGGAGQVWLNTDSNVYHCVGTKYYGKTKTGAYMTEDAAKAKGGHPDHGKACTK